MRFIGSSENMKKLQLCDENRGMLLNIAVSMDKLVEDIFGPYFILDMFERIDLKKSFKDTGTLKAFDIEGALAEYVRYDNLMYKKFCWFLLILFHIICNLTIIEDIIEDFIEDFILDGFEDYEDHEDYEDYENLHYENIHNLNDVHEDYEDSVDIWFILFQIFFTFIMIEDYPIFVGLKYSDDSTDSEDYLSCQTIKL